MKKRNLFSILTVIGLGLVVTVSSCSKKEIGEDNAKRANSKATVKGRAFAELDLTNVDLEVAPVGTKLYARLNSEDLVTNPVNGAYYEDIIYQTTVREDGNFEFVVDANEKFVNVDIYPEQFLYDQQQAGQDVKTLFHSDYIGESVFRGQVKYVEFEYDYTPVVQ